ncbi:MAG: S41 family peptidase, partial [Bacteroidota bacterium]
MKKHLLAALLACANMGFAQAQSEYLTKSEIEEDLELLDGILQSKSSYQGLNGYQYQEDFAQFLEQMEGRTVSRAEFGLFLSATIGKIGDRHAFVRGYDLPESLYFPVSFAPLDGRVVVLQFERAERAFALWDADFPYLQAMNGHPIQELLPQLNPAESQAPESAYLTRTVRELRDVETVFSILGSELPNPLPITLANEEGQEKEVLVTLVPDDQKSYLWDERYQVRDFFYEYDEEKTKDRAVIEQFFALEDGIGHIRIPSMVEQEEVPLFFEVLDEFMLKAKESEGLIIDVRDNGGGTRDLIQTLAGYIVHPDSVHIGNVTRQRGEIPLQEELVDRLHGRWLYARGELDNREQKAADGFMASFTPRYELSAEKYSEYYYYVLNGEKLSEGNYHYRQPVYVLANERSFSAASVLVSVLKDLPNVMIAG